MRILIGLPLIAMLTGCGSPLVDAMTGPEVLAKQDDAYCTSIGAQQGSPTYAQCRMQMTQNREVRHEGYRNRAVVGMAIAAEMNKPTPPSPTVTCRTWGNTTTCN